MTETLFEFNANDFCIFHKLDRVPPSTHNTMHTHENIELYYFLSGDCRYLAEGTEYPLYKGDIMIMRPLEAHHLLVCSGTVPYERIVANIQPDLLSNLDPENLILKHIFERPLGRLNRFDTAAFTHTRCADVMTEIATYGREMCHIDILSRLLFVLSEIDRASKHISYNPKKGNIGDRIIDYVNENLFKDISLKQISEVFFLSQSQINRIFKKSTGSSVGQYITAKRLITARNRIRTGEAVIKVSEECGYEDYSSFYRSYKARFGCSPQEDKRSAEE